MLRVTVLAFVLPAALAAQSPALDAAASALGGRERVLAVKTLSLDGTATNLNFGQTLSPSDPTSWDVTQFRRLYDFANRRWFLDLTRVPRFVTANTAPQRQRTGLDGEVAYNVGNTGTMTRAGGTAAQDRAWDLLYHPVGFIQAASRPGATVAESAGPSDTRVVTLTTGAGAMAMVVDARTGLPARFERRTHHPMLGDVTLVTETLDYRDVGGLRVPMRFVQRFEDLFTLWDVRLADVRVDEDLSGIAATDSVRNAVAQAGAPTPPAPTVTVDTVVPGVWRIAGGTHHTIAIEQSNRVVLVEAPQGDARTLAAIAKAREIAPPGKPVTMVVNTHHHFDHSGGFRAAVSEGLVVVTQRGNQDFYERVVYPRPHTITADALQRNRKPLNLLVVGDRHTLRDELRTIEIHHVASNAHNANMLVVYLPAERILIQADLYNPPAANAPPPPAFPFAANLVENVQKRGLQVDRVVGVHGLPVAWADVVAAAAANR